MNNVDVLIRSHGNSRFLLDAIDSVKTQVFTGTLRIHVSAFKVDRSLLNCLEAMSNEGEICLHHCELPGYSYPLNLMLACASGDYVAILDHDDLMRKNRVQLQFDFLNTRPEFSAVGSSIRIIDDFGREVSFHKYESDPEKIRKTLGIKTPLAHPASMIRKSELISSGGYRGFYDTAEDYDLWLRLSESSNLSNLPEVLSDYRLHDLQVTRTSRRRNLTAGVAAVDSARMRRKGRLEIHERFHSAEEYGSKLLVKFRVTRLICAEYFLRMLREKGLAEKRFWAASFLMMLFMVSPRKAFWAIRLIIRRLNL